MRLANITIINHKSLKHVHIPLAEDSYVTLIGLNDAGKTTVLKSIELFFSDNKNLPQITETSRISSVSNTPLNQDLFENIFTDLGLVAPHYDSRSVYVLGELKIEHILTVEELDSLAPSDHLQYVLSSKNKGDSIYILKVLNPVGEYFIFCKDSLGEDGEPRQLWNQKQNELKSLQSTYGIQDSDIPNQNKRGGLKNIERIVAIYGAVSVGPMWSRYDFKKDRDFFPSFEYLNWDINIDQLQSLITTAIGPSIDQSLKDIQAEVNKQQDDVNKIANDRLAELFAKYSTHLPDSITGLSANVNIPLAKNTTEIFVSKNTSDKQIHIADQGDGIKRQIGLGLIRAIAEENIGGDSEDVKYLWVFDEPETHLYPQAQRELAEILRDLSGNKFQVVVSTHSTTFVDKTRLKDVFKTELKDGYTQLLSTKDTEDALNTLGVRNSDFLFYDKFLAVEGATEYYLLDHFHQMIYGTTLSDVGVRAISLGGESNRTHYKKILEAIVGDYRKPDNSIAYLLDKDTGTSGDGIYLIGDIADFEDSIANDIWINLLKHRCGVNVSNNDLEDMRSKIDITLKDTKLYKQLTARVASDTSRNDYLKSKGEALANDLKKYITYVSQIPQVFKDVFGAFHST
jgi:predicted ATP-binding protein involved in virulence